MTGYLIEAVETGRQSLQPLMLAYAFDSFAVDGALAFAKPRRRRWSARSRRTAASRRAASRWSR